MEPHREDQKKPEARGEPKVKRFRLIKLEERIAPTKGANFSIKKVCGCGTAGGFSDGYTGYCSIE